ncbi:uncharacterized protein LOC134089213 [Sardina pilchardus]|uniref:uncharacterized protein LOC134089213 n=1 Tax=Sardina pilchardus TaxID=27697 RepID=UPI002E11BB00
MKLISFALVCLLLQRCSAEGQDLGGKAFTFPEETDHSYVKLQPAGKWPVSTISVCLRFYTDLLQKEQCFFSLATRSHSNGFLFCKDGLNRHHMYIGNDKAEFFGLPDELNAWNSFCATWDSETGLTQVWLNGKPSSRKTLFKGGSQGKSPFIVIGQDQDKYGGGMHKNDAVVGQLTDVHMWDRVISPCEIENFSKNRDFSRGNMINWHDLVFTINGNVVLEDKIASSNCSSFVAENTTSSWTPATQDLSGKVFTFGAATADSYVLLELQRQNIDVASVCLKYFSDIPSKDREQTFFSLATRSHSNGFLLCKEGLNRHQVYIGSARAEFWGLPDELNAWNSFCATWDSETGLTQVWLNGKPSSRKTLFKGGSLRGVPVVALGQDQDEYGGRFSSNDALIGQIADVHMWDRVISPCEVKQFTENKLVGGGNLISWEALEYTTYGDVVMEKQIDGIGLQDCAVTAL